MDDEKSTSDEEILEEAKERYKEAEQAWSENRKAAIEDMKFRAGDQWPEKIKSDREKKFRPTLVVDKLNQYVRQVVNDGRQNRPSVKVRPVDDNGDPEVADALQGIIRHILDRSNADEALDSALESAVVGGFGYFRVLTDYAHEKTFDQEIEVGRIRNPLSVLLDPNCQKADGSDARYGFVLDEIPKEVYKSQYPKAKFTDWDADDVKKYSDGWMNEKNIRVCEYWYKVEEPSELHLLADGTSVDGETYERAIAQGVPVPEILETREIPLCKVKWCRLSGAEILEKQDWLGKYIPIVPVYGNEYDIDGKVIYSGLIRAAKDPQRLYNFSRSAYAERVALTPKAPNVAAAGQVENHPEWQDANTEAYSVLVYDPVDINGTPLPPPARQPASDIPEGFARDMQLSEHDIQASMGMYAASLGQQSNEKSGKAIMARQREGDTATFHYQDNLNRAIRHLGRILVDLIPKIYDSQRVIRIVGENGEQTQARINPNQQEPMVRQGQDTIYNLNVGTYDVSVAAGPSYTTKRQEAAEAQMQLAQAVPQMWQMAGDIMIKNMDWPGADDIAERWKLMLPPPIQQSIQAKEQGQDPKVIAAVAPLQQALQQSGQQIQAAEAGIAERDQALAKMQSEVSAAKMENERLKAESDNAVGDQAIKMREVNIKAQEAAIKEYSAETERLKVTMTQASPQDIQNFVAQAMAQSTEQYMAALGQFQQTTGASMQQIAEAIAQMSQAHQQTSGMVQTMAQDMNAPPVVERGPDGRAVAVRKGNRRQVVQRGPDGKMMGLQ